jgi:hypothetical protein
MYKTIQKFLIFSIHILLLSCAGNKNTTTDFTTLFEKSQGTETPEYKEVIAYYQQLSNSFDEISMFTFGQTDSGEPLHLVVYNQQGISNINEIKKSSKNKILINNGIHPGESDGIDASMLLLRDLVQNDSLKQKYQNSVICIIPVYNIGGALNRNSHSRTNQNGPLAYGFRGNARNYDLNRDFIKQDTKNAAAFAEIFHAINPDIFIDNHVSNGADYPYTLTYISSMKERLAPSMQVLTYESCIPILKDYCQTGSNFELFPYVELKGETPESGIVAFNDLPRYAMGFASLFHSLSFTVETHMLKPFPERVQATLSFMNSMIAYAIDHSQEIETARSAAKNWAKNQSVFAYNYQLDESQVDEIRFKGYEAIYPEHPVTGLKQLGYDQMQPYEKYIP